MWLSFLSSFVSWPVCIRSSCWRIHDEAEINNKIVLRLSTLQCCWNNINILKITIISRVTYQITKPIHAQEVTYLSSVSHIVMIFDFYHIVHENVHSEFLFNRMAIVFAVRNFPCFPFFNTNLIRCCCLGRHQSTDKC